MSFFHLHGYEQAVTAIQAERQAAVERIEAAMKVATDDQQVQQLRQELHQVEASTREKQQRLKSCLF